MAYSVFGYVYDKDCNTLENVKVYPYFKKVDSASDDSKWTDNAYITDSEGYYTFDVEDDNLLGSEGRYKKGTDKLYVTFVYGGDGTRDATNMTSAAFFDHTIENNEDQGKQINITIYDKRAPVIDSSSLPADNLLTQHNYTMSETSHADYTWQDGSCNETDSVSQKYTYDLVEIFKNHVLDTTIYDWDEIDPREVDNNSSDTYKFVDAGDYHISIKVREKWDTYTIVEKDVRVKYNEPSVDFDWTPTQTNDWDGPKIKGQEEITFHNKTTSIGSDQNRVENTYKYDWEIKDKNQDDSDNTQTETDKDYDFEPKHKFQSEGTYDVTLTCKWNDGFDDKEVSITKQIHIYPFRIIPEFTFPIPKNRGQDIEFDPSNTYGDTDKISKYDWVIEDNYPAPDSNNGLYTFADDEDSIFNEGSPDNTQEVDNTYNINDTEKPKVKFHSIGDKNAKLTITYNDGWKDVTIDKEHTISPVKYNITQDFSISDISPQGRDKEVTFTNTSSPYTQDSTDLGYTIDWHLEDFYSECNLDNPDPGNKTDNGEDKIDVAKDTALKHHFQNTESNKIKLTIRYDDGYQQQTKSIEKTVTPVVYQDITPEFEWDITPKGRDQEVSFTNKTSDPQERFRRYKWYVQDQYNKYNPDNDNYSDDITNNDTVYESDDKDYIMKHHFQDKTDSDVKLEYYYDDGFCERFKDITHTVTKDQYSINPVIGYDKLTVGKTEVTWTNDSTGDTSRMLDVKWTWNDKTFPDGDDEITIRDDQDPNIEQKFTWQYPSRKPFTSDDNSTDYNFNKTVYLEVRIDNGWKDNNDSNKEDSNYETKDYGGKCYYSTSSTFEATPYEINTNIGLECNVDNYKHGEDNS